MKTLILTFLAVLASSLISHSQPLFTQYFDGNDTNPANSIIIVHDTMPGDLWHVGPPQKSIFDTAVTYPNVLITDTLNFYTPGNISRFSYQLPHIQWYWGIYAIQWMQKLDMDQGLDGGYVEFSVDTGQSWHNAFTSPYAYAFYGFHPSNVDTLSNGEIAFSGTDSTWKNIWLCFDFSWISTLNQEIWIRHTFMSDTIDNNKEGWMIDNLLVHPTIIHTVDDEPQEEYLKVFPSPTSGRVNIQTKVIEGFHIIEKIEVYSLSGVLLEQYSNCPTKFFIDIGHHPDGIYLVKVKTNIKTETSRIILRSGK